MMVLHVLKKHKYNRTHAAKELDIAIRSMRNYIYKLKRKGFMVPESTFGVKEIQRIKCPNCDYFAIKRIGEEEYKCYACKHLGKG